MMIRTKFVCHSADAGNKTVHLGVVTSGSEENKRYFAATPGGQISLHVLNDAAFRMFQPGRTYYVEFSPADEQ